MITANLEMHFLVDPVAGLDQHSDAVADALYEIERLNPALFDAGVGATLATGQVRITLGASGEDWDCAVAEASNAIRRAITSAGGQLPQWNDSSMPSVATYSLVQQLAKSA
jgi:hypothetical protein